MKLTTALWRIVAGAAALAFSVAAQASNVSLKPQTGSITTQNLNASGDCTPGSCVVMDISTAGAVQVGVLGTYTASGGLSVEVTLDWTNWTTLAGASTLTKVSDNSTTSAVPSAATGAYQVSGIIAGARGLRVVAKGAVTGTATVTISPAEPAIGNSSAGGGGVDPRVSQGSTTSGQSGTLIQGAASTGTPAYTNGTTNPLSLDTAGNLRVNVVAGSTSGAVLQGSTTAGQSGGLVQGAVTTSAPTYTTGQTNPLSIDTAGNLRTSATISDGSSAGLGATTDSAATAGGTGSVNAKLRLMTTQLGNATTGTQSNVSSSATDTTCLASNASRKGATFYNDSTAILYLLLASAVSSSSVYSVQVASQGYYELPFRYTGVVKCVWASANGNARVTELQ